VLANRIFTSLIAVLLMATLGFGLSACGSSDAQTIDFGAGIDPNKPAPRGRPYPCPATPPEQRALCSTRDLSCEYDQGTCLCAPDPMGTFGALAWNCPFDAAATACPETQPEPDSMCTPLLDAADCSYGRQTACHCAGEAQTWACWDPANCPKQQPDDASACDPIGSSCHYASKRCECFARGWQCADAR
jgi:hypothetical protein